MSAPHDDRLLEVLEAMAARLRRGDDPGFARAVGENPELAADLRELWGAVVVAEEVRRGRSAADLVDPHADTGCADTGSAAMGERPAPSRESSRPPSIQGYEILGELGRGGMGVVYKAKQLALGRIVALKMLHPGDEPSAESLGRFRTEAESAARLDHPHIVPIHEVGANEGRPFFTMRYVAGESLAQRLAREGPMGAREAAALLLPAARAIEYAHGRGVLHRDLKPSNILLDEAGVPLVADFGLARRIEAQSMESRRDLTRSGAILGTPGYMAPEQASGGRGKLGPAVDVYGLGAVLYHMLTGRPPFQAASPIDTVLSVLEEDPVPPRVLNPRIDRDVEMIVLKSLQKPIELRYATAGAFADDLQAFLAGEPVAARSAGLRMVVARLLRETHHASVLENWGLLWMWHSLAILVLCGLTYGLQMAEVASPGPYILIWSVGASGWGLTFWALRHRGGPVTFVERQIAHVWGGSIAGTCALFIIEIAMGLPVLTLSPVLAILSGMIFVVKAAVLAGHFYVPAAASFFAALPMALYPRAAIPIFGIVTAASFFLPGLAYHRRRRRVDEGK